MIAITHQQLIQCARNLHSEDGENPEYDRALGELVCEIEGLSIERALPRVAQEISPTKDLTT